MSSRSKGQNGQREALALWKKIYPEAQHSGMKQQGEGGKYVPDIEYVGRWWVEIKRDEKGVNKKGDLTETWWWWWTKTVQDCPRTHDPILMFRVNNAPWYVMTMEHERPISWSSFEEEIKRAKKRTRTTTGRTLRPAKHTIPSVS